MENHLIALLWESIFANTIWPFTTDVRYFAMQAFGSYAMQLPTIIAVLGGVIGTVINYFLGTWLTLAQQSGSSVLSDANYRKWQKRCEILVWVIGIFSFIHLVNALVFALGFFRVKLSNVLLAAALGQGLYYGYYFSQAAS